MIALSTSPYLGHIITTEVIVWGICIGAILAFTVYFMQMHFLGSLVRALMSCGVGEENAKSLDEIGKNNAFYRHFLEDNSSLRKTVSVVGGSVPRNTEGGYDFASVRLYIEPEALENARKRYERDTKVWMYIVGVAACVIVGVAMHFTLPLLLGFLPSI